MTIVCAQSTPPTLPYLPLHMLPFCGVGPLLLCSPWARTLVCIASYHPLVTLCPPSRWSSGFLASSFQELAVYCVQVDLTQHDEKGNSCFANVPHPLNRSPCLQVAAGISSQPRISISPEIRSSWRSWSHHDRRASSNVVGLHRDIRDFALASTISVLVVLQYFDVGKDCWCTADT